MTTRQAWCAKCGDVVLCDDHGCVYEHDGVGARQRLDHAFTTGQQQGSAPALAAFCAICIDGVTELRSVQLEEDGPVYTICRCCDDNGVDVERNHRKVDARPRGHGRRRCYLPVDEALGGVPIVILRRIRHFDWVEPAMLADAIGIPSNDVDGRRRNQFDVEMSRLTRRGYLERVGEPMSFVYRITPAGRDEYAFQMARSFA